MKITFDKEADTMYIELNEGNFSSNKKIDNETILDLDEDGKILGIELLNINDKIANNFTSDINIQSGCVSN